MPDREKVIKGLEQCKTVNGKCNECPYNDGLINFTVCTSKLCNDALELLKEQEAVEPKTESSAKGWWYCCGACGWWLFQVCDTVHFDDRKRIHFCASCGRSVKWE